MTLMYSKYGRHECETVNIFRQKSYQKKSGEYYNCDVLFISIYV